MKAAFCYLPIIKARQGSFDAIRSISPIARSRLCPLFDIPRPRPDQAKDQVAYLHKKVNGIMSCWAPDRAVYIDAHDFDITSRVEGELQLYLSAIGCGTMD
jgi:hypothetical protein